MVKRSAAMLARGARGAKPPRAKLHFDEPRASARAAPRTRTCLRIARVPRPVAKDAVPLPARLPVCLPAQRLWARADKPPVAV